MPVLELGGEFPPSNCWVLIQMDTFSIIAGVASIIGLIGSLIGFVSWRFERKTRRQLENELKRRVWSQISKVTGLMTDLEKDLQKRDGYDSILQAEGKLSFMIRDLIREACTVEERLSIETIKAWRQTGKLGSDWQEKLALTLLMTSEINKKDLDQILSKFRNWDEIPEDHPCYAENWESRAKKQNRKQNGQEVSTET